MNKLSPIALASSALNPKSGTAARISLASRMDLIITSFNLSDPGSVDLGVEKEELEKKKQLDALKAGQKESQRWSQRDSSSC